MKTLLNLTRHHDTTPKADENSASRLFDKYKDSIQSEWLDAEGAAAYLKISVGALRNLTYRKTITPFRLGRRVRYRLHDLRSLLTKGDTHAN